MSTDMALIGTATCIAFMDHFANQVLGVINGHPEWATFVICLTAFAEFLRFSQSAISGNRHPRCRRNARVGRHP